MRTGEQTALLAIGGNVWALRGSITGSVTDLEFCEMTNKIVRRGLTILPQLGDLGTAAVATAPPNMSLFAIHLREGEKRTVIYDDRSGNSTHLTSYTVKFPRAYLIVFLRNRVVTNGYLFRAPEVMRDSTSFLYPFPLPNLDHSGQICIGGWSADATHSSEQQVESYASQFLGSSFNSDMTGWESRIPSILGGPPTDRRSPVENQMSIFAKWAELSLEGKDPIDWPGTGTRTSLQALITLNWGDLED